MTSTTRVQRRMLKKANLALGSELLPVDRDLWPDTAIDPDRIGVWRSSDFLVQVFEAGGGYVRISVCRTVIDPTSDRWVDGISWDDLQRIKNAVGFADRDAVELFPAAGDVVNVANMRHLWVLPAPFEKGWRS